MAVTLADAEKGQRALALPGDDVAASDSQAMGKHSYWGRFKSSLFEYRGIQPITAEERNDGRYINVFTLWVSMSLSILPLVFGILGPVVFGLGLRDSSLIILFFSLLTCIPCAYLATLGPKTGLRQMVLSRYSFGRYIVSLPVLLNLATLAGFVAINNVIGGGVLAGVSDYTISWNVGIIITGILGFVISALGYRVLHYYERFAWVVALISIIIMTGVGGKHLREQAEFEPPAASTVMSFGGLMAGYFIPWAAVASDYSAYMPPEAPSSRIFLYTFGGLILPSVPLLILGAAIGGAMPNIPTWSAGYEAHSIGGLLSAILEPAGGFGKFILTLLALTIIANVAGTVYAVTLNFQALVPGLVRVPRFIFAIVTTAVTIPVAVEAAKSFFLSLENFVAVIGYWSAAWSAVVIAEHLVIRKGDCSSYDQGIWDRAALLPTGVPALAASVCSIGLVVPAMAQVWYTGPIGARTGDIGFELAFAMSFVLYIPFRMVEVRLRGKI